VVLGIIDALVESYLMLVTFVGLLVGVLSEPEVLSSAFVFGLILVLEKLITIFHSNGFLDEFIPKNLWVVLRGQQPARVVPLQTPAPTPMPKPQLRPEDILSVR
jgi:hypothetical protein